MLRFLSRASFLAIGLGMSVLGADRPTPPPPPLPPPPTATSSPTAEFRRWLALPPSQREAELAALPPERQKLAASLRAKLGEYSALPDAEREARLKVLDIRWHLTPLMRLDPGQRGDRLASVPSDLRPLVEERLRQWDATPKEIQREFWEHESAVRQFLGLASAGPSERRQLITRLPADQRQSLRETINRWNALPSEQQQRLSSNFQRFFDLPAAEKRKTLGALSELERRQMEATLKTFEALPAERRRACIEAFGRFASLSEAERDAFLQKAELWQAMTADERQAWRNMVNRLPPLPPGYKRQPPMPPPPPTHVPERSQSVAVTNVTR
jgi:hypothetical protein